MLLGSGDCRIVIGINRENDIALYTDVDALQSHEQINRVIQAADDCIICRAAGLLQVTAPIRIDLRRYKNTSTVGFRVLWCVIVTW